MNYKTRPGVVMLRVCDVDLLAATRAIWSQCPKIRPLPRLWGGCWALMEKGRTSDEVIAFFSRLFKQTEEATRNKLTPIFEKLYSEGFLIIADDDYK